MDDDSMRQPRPEAAARQAREAAALRENLRRRKAQARARDDAAEAEEKSTDRQD
jgi:hypothetical protein